MERLVLDIVAYVQFRKLGNLINRVSLSAFCHNGTVSKHSFALLSRAKVITNSVAFCG